MIYQHLERRSVAGPLFVLMGWVCLGGFWGMPVSAGTLEGAVHYIGPKPLSTIMKVVKDQDHCGTEISVQTINLHDDLGALSNAVVSVEGIEAVKFEGENVEDEPSVINLQCAFSPRIATARLGQKIEVRNQDSILHNAHIKLGERTILNVAQVPNGIPIVKRLKRPGLHSIRCDKHVFMKAFLQVFPHHYYAQTNDTGAFRITDIPPGKHPIRVWHESLGILEKMVNVPKTGTVRVKFTYP